MNQLTNDYKSSLVLFVWVLSTSTVCIIFLYRVIKIYCNECSNDMSSNLFINSKSFHLNNARACLVQYSEYYLSFYKHC